MKLLHLLVINAIKDIWKYRSFLALILVVMLIDEVASHVSPKLSQFIEKPELSKRMADISSYTYTQLVDQLIALGGHIEIFLVLLGGFFLKALLSLWPSSDMRRMHRQERSGFGVLDSLLQLRWKQVGWDFVAVSITCLTSAIGLVIAFLIGLLFWSKNQSPYSAIFLLVTAACLWPVIIAGFSYSSKIAIISNGSYLQKLKVFVLLLSKLSIFIPSWLFYGFRIYLEAFILGVVPIVLSRYVDTWIIRIIIVSLLICPIYAFLKMVSFKLFLYLFRNQSLVREEYAKYYRESSL